MVLLTACILLDPHDEVESPTPGLYKSAAVHKVMIGDSFHPIHPLLLHSDHIIWQRCLQSLFAKRALVLMQVLPETAGCLLLPLDLQVSQVLQRCHVLGQSCCSTQLQAQSILHTQKSCYAGPIKACRVDQSRLSNVRIGLRSEHGLIDARRPVDQAPAGTVIVRYNC